MSLRTVFSKILILFLSIFVLGSFVGVAFGYFNLLSKSDSLEIGIGDWVIRTPIYTAQEFYDFATSSTSVSTDEYYLANDIDFTGFTWDYNSSYDSNIFKGTFDGAGFTLSNISITSTDTSSVGLSIFTKMDGATIKNVTIENFSMGFTSTFFNATPLESAVLVSDVIGINNIIENITLNNIEVIGNSLDGAGGLVTSVRGNADLIMRNIQATNVTVLNTSKRVGGLISRIFAGTGVVIIEDIDFQGNLASDSRTSNTGGIVGTVQDAQVSITRAIVEYEATGIINLADTSLTFASDRYVGGIVGNNNSPQLTISDSFYTGTLLTNIKYLGAIVGRERSSATITNTYYSNVIFKDNYVTPVNTTGLHGTIVNASSMPGITWWNSFAQVYMTSNSLWGQDLSGRLGLIR